MIPVIGKRWGFRHGWSQTRKCCSAPTDEAMEAYTSPEGTQPFPQAVVLGQEIPKRPSREPGNRTALSGTGPALLAEGCQREHPGLASSGGMCPVPFAGNSPPPLPHVADVTGSRYSGLFIAVNLHPRTQASEKSRPGAPLTRQREVWAYVPASLLHS